MIYINLYENRTSSGFLTREEANAAAEPGCYGVLVFDDINHTSEVILNVEIGWYVVKFDKKSTEEHVVWSDGTGYFHPYKDKKPGVGMLASKYFIVDGPLELVPAPNKPSMQFHMKG